MRLVTFLKNNKQRTGAIIEQDSIQYVLDLNQVEPRIPSDMLSLLKGGDDTLAIIQQVIRHTKIKHCLNIQQVKVLAPVPRPGKIICVGRNYKEHAAEGNSQVGEYPTLFTKYSTCVIAPNDPILVPLVTDKVDYEAELACVIGRTVRHVSEAEAYNSVAGYIVFNDVTARDYQRRTSQWDLGKSFDTFAPMGPMLVTRDEVSNPHDLNIWLTLNDQEMQRANTSQMVFTIPFLISYISQAVTLEPGDILATGTPAGVGAFRDPPVFMKPGDIVSVNIEKIGTLTNPVLAEQKHN